MVKKFIVYIITIILVACNDISNSVQQSIDTNWKLLGKVELDNNNQPVIGAKVTIRRLEKGYTLLENQQSNSDGEFQFILPHYSQPIAVELTVSKEGLASSKVQSLWLNGSRQLLIVQSRVQQQGLSRIAPTINLSGVSAYRQLAVSEALDLIIQATSTNPLSSSNSQAPLNLWLGSSDGQLLASSNTNTLKYQLPASELAFQGETILKITAIDANNNRTSLYLPLSRISIAADSIAPPASSLATSIAVQAYTIASPKYSSETRNVITLIDFYIPIPNTEVRGVKIYRKLGDKLQQTNYSRSKENGEFYYRDSSTNLIPGTSYNYTFAYDGEQFSKPGPSVPVRLLPRYQVELEVPANQSLITSGSNILFRWHYLVDRSKLPSHSTREETFAIYQKKDWNSIITYSYPKSTPSDSYNSISLPLSLFSPGRPHSWNVSSSLHWNSQRQDSGGYWQLQSLSLPSANQSYATNGFFTFIREVVQ